MIEPAPRGRLVFLGTGGGAHVARNHAAYALEFSPEEALLLDTGGGFHVVKSLKLAGVDLAALRYIFISHRHSDHITGLEPLLLHLGLYALRTDRHASEVVILAHPGVVEAAQTLITTLASSAISIIESRGERVRWVPLTPDQPVELRPGLRLVPFAVDHAPFDGMSLGCVVEFEFAGRTRRLCYSGDTRPTPALPRYAAGADILLHEAGGLDSGADAVHLPGHSTAGEVGRLARECATGRVFLVHLPDDSLVRPIRDEVRQFYGGPVHVPDDLDTFDLSEIFEPPVDSP